MAKKKAKSKAKSKAKKAPVGGLYQLTIPKMGGSFNVIASNNKDASVRFRKLLKVKRLPKGFTIKKVPVVGAGCKIVCLVKP